METEQKESLSLVKKFCKTQEKKDFDVLKNSTKVFFYHSARLAIKRNKNLEFAKKILKMEQTTLKILSWNINGLRSNVLSQGKLASCGWKKEIDLTSDLGKLIKKHNPDIICLQETKCNEQVCKCITIPNYYQYWSNSTSKAGYSGVSIWSKIVPDTISYNIPTLPNKDTEGRIIILDFGSFVLINTYSPNSGTNFEYRTKVWDISIKKYLKQLKKESRAVVWCGDLNVSPDPIDVHKGVNENVAGFTTEERNNFKDILKIGYIDTLRYFNPYTTGLYSWWNMRVPIAREKNLGMRLDFFVVSEKFIDYIENSEILTEYGKKEVGKATVSDHAPILLTIKKKNKYVNGKFLFFD